MGAAAVGNMSYKALEGLKLFRPPFSPNLRQPVMLEGVKATTPESANVVANLLSRAALLIKTRA